jgi:hypothetical protein
MIDTRKPLARKTAAPFSFREALASADETCALAPFWSFTERHKPKGSLAYRAAIPLRLAPTGNTMRHAQGYALGKLKSECLLLMRAQLSTRPTSPLSGRPQVLAIRFSSRAPDGYADFGKIPVDCLVKLGVIRDDNQGAIELRQWCEKGPRSGGFVVIEVHTGAST